MKTVYRVKKMIMMHMIRGKMHFNAIAEKRVGDTGETSTVKIYGSLEREGYEGADGNIRLLLVPEGMLAEPGTAPKPKKGGKEEVERHHVEIVYEKKIKTLKGGEEVEDDLPPPPPPDVVEFKPKIPQKEITAEDVEAGKKSIINFFMNKPTNGDLLCGPNICPDCRSVAKGPIRLKCSVAYCRFEKRPPGEPMKVDTSPPPTPTPVAETKPKGAGILEVGKIKLTIKGHEIEMTREELKELRKALDELVKG